MKSHAFHNQVLGLAIALLIAGCSVEQNNSGEPSTAGGTTTPGDNSKGGELTIRIDGSSTVAPISTAISEVFDDEHPGVTPKVNVSGTGGGFEKFSKGETDISNASRAILPDEVASCEKNGIKFTEVMVATDGLTVVVNKENDWCKALTVAQLVQIWEKDSKVTNWSDVDPSWPQEPIHIFAPDSKSGTYDYFKEVTVGKKNPMRSDYQPNTDDNVLVTGVAGDKYALGYFGYAYYVESQDKLQAVAISPTENVADAVSPTQATIEDGTYKPLSRPLYIYINGESLKNPLIADFAKFHISDRGQELVALKQYIKLNASQLAASRAALEKSIADIDAKPAEQTKPAE